MAGTAPDNAGVCSDSMECGACRCALEQYAEAAKPLPLTFVVPFFHFCPTFFLAFPLLGQKSQNMPCEMLGWQLVQFPGGKQT